MSDTRLTTNIKKPLMMFLKVYSQKKNTSQRQILEEALEMYKKEQQKQEMLEGYNQFADNTEEQSEWLSIANNPKNL